MARRFISWTAGGVAALLLAATVPLVAAASPSGTGQTGWDAKPGRLDPAAFHNPPATDRPHAFWFWNGKLTEDELSRQLDEMKAKGIEEFFIHPRQGLGGEFGVTENGYYLSKDYFDKVGFALAEAKRRGMKAWLYDDLNWPSGFAGGRTVKGGDVDGKTVPADPDYLPWYLTPVAKDVTGPANYDQPIPVPVPGGWSVSDGVLTVNGGEVGLAKDGADWSGYRMEFDLTVDALSGGWTMHSRDTANLVMVNLTSTSPYNPEAASTFGVHVRVNGAYQLIGARIPAGTTIRDGERHHVATDIRGDTVTLFLDGREVGSRSDPRIGALAKGRVGLRSGQDERARFDNLKVTALDGGATLLADDFSAGLARWDVTQSPASSRRRRRPAQTRRRQLRDQRAGPRRRAGRRLGRRAHRQGRRRRPAALGRAGRPLVPAAPRAAAAGQLPPGPRARPAVRRHAQPRGDAEVHRHHPRDVRAPLRRRLRLDDPGHLRRRAGLLQQLPGQPGEASTRSAPSRGRPGSATTWPATPGTTSPPGSPRSGTTPARPPRRPGSTTTTRFPTATTRRTPSRWPTGRRHTTSR